MKHNTLKAIALSFILFGCQPRSCYQNEELRSISFIDRNGMTETVSNKIRLKQYKKTNFIQRQSYQKILRIYARDPQGNIKAKMTSYYPNGQPKQYLEIVNSRAFGPYIEWHENGQIKLKACVIGGEPDLNSAAESSWLFDGCASVWDAEGRQIANFNYDKGKLDGYSFEFHKNGEIWKKNHYKENFLDGLSQIFLDDGSLLQVINYHQGKRNGKAYRYWSKKKQAAEEVYHEGVLDEGRYYDQKGNMIAQIHNGNGYRAAFSQEGISELHEFKNGFPEGEVQVFGSDQKLFRNYFIKNGQKHGVETEYYEQPKIRHQPKMSITWFEGKIQGIAKTWYDNGVQESNREMSGNAKNGLSTAWYRDGGLMLIEEYEYNKLNRGEYYRKGDSFPFSTVKDGRGTATLFDSEGNFIQKIHYENGEPAPRAS